MYLKQWGIIPAIFRHLFLAFLLLIFVHPPLELPVKIKKQKQTNKQKNKTKHFIHGYLRIRLSKRFAKIQLLVHHQLLRNDTNSFICSSWLFRFSLFHIYSIVFINIVWMLLCLPTSDFTWTSRSQFFFNYFPS